MRPHRLCVACGTHFAPLAHRLNQRDCSSKTCRFARRGTWQHERMRADRNYRANQAGAQPPGAPAIPITAIVQKLQIRWSPIAGMDLNIGDSRVPVPN